MHLETAMGQCGGFSGPSCSGLSLHIGTYLSPRLPENCSGFKVGVKVQLPYLLSFQGLEGNIVLVVLPFDCVARGLAGLLLGQQVSIDVVGDHGHPVLGDCDHGKEALVRLEPQLGKKTILIKLF